MSVTAQWEMLGELKRIRLLLEQIVESGRNEQDKERELIKKDKEDL